MELTRDRFIEQFAIPLEVHCLRHWPKRRREAPIFLARCLHEWIKTAAGRMALAGPLFGQLARPVIEELHRVTPKGERPDAKALACKIYDALDAAGIDVTIAPPAGATG